MSYYMLPPFTLYQLYFKYKNVKKNVLVDRDKQADIIEDSKRFFNKIKEHKLYLVEFNDNSIINDKIYPFDYIITGEDCWLIIIITYNEYIFLANSNICKAWTRVGDTFLHP